MRTLKINDSSIFFLRITRTFFGEKKSVRGFRFFEEKTKTSNAYNKEWEKCQFISEKQEKRWQVLT